MNRLDLFKVGLAAVVQRMVQSKNQALPSVLIRLRMINKNSIGSNFWTG